MCRHDILHAVEKSIAELEELFCRQPTRFFTENDLVCCLYSILQRRLEACNNATHKARDATVHQLAHCEYPTPFRCDMRGNAFAVKRDDERRTLEGGRFQRGHYDIVVMNPGLLDVETLTYEVVRGQDYRRFVQQVRDHLNPEVPVVLYGIELIYRRSPLTPGSIRDFMEKVEQDTDKLLCSQGLEGFMDNVKMLVFVKGTDERQQDGLRERFGARPEIHLLFAH